MRRIWLLALLAVLLTTACRIESNILIDLNADGSGSFGIELGMDEEFQALIAEEGGEGFEFDDLLDISGMAAELPGAVATARTEGDMTFSGATFDFANDAELQEVLTAGQGTGGDISVLFTDDTATISVVLEGFDLGGDLEDGEDFDFGEDFIGLGDNFFSGSVIVSMPGEVSSHNADKVMSDGRLQWDLKLDASDTTISAVSILDGGSGFPVWALVVLVLIAIALLAWIISMQRRRNSSMAALESATAPTDPTGWGDNEATEKGDTTPGTPDQGDPDPPSADLIR